MWSRWFFNRCYVLYYIVYIASIKKNIFIINNYNYYSYFFFFFLMKKSRKIYKNRLDFKLETDFQVLFNKYNLSRKLRTSNDLKYCFFNTYSPQYSQQIIHNYTIIRVKRRNHALFFLFWNVRIICKNLQNMRTKIIFLNLLGSDSNS